MLPPLGDITMHDEQKPTGALELDDHELDAVSGGVQIDHNHQTIQGASLDVVDTTPTLSPTLNIDPLAVQIDHNH